MDIAILFILICLNGVFAMSEIALVTARKSRLQKRADYGDRSAAIALRLGEQPTQFLSTIQIGITAIGTLNGIVGEAVFAGPLGEALQRIGLDNTSSSIGATTLVVMFITYVSIVIGELVPKRIALLYAESIARLMAYPIMLAAKLSGPFVLLLSVSTNLILKLTGKCDEKNADLTEEDIHAMLVEGSQAGLIEKQEHEIVRNVFRLDGRQIASLMTPRNEIIFLDIEQPIEENLEMLIASDHSRFPVCRGTLHEVLGVITAKRLLKLHLKGGSNDAIADYLVPPVYMPESMNGMKLLEVFRESGVQMVFIVDEYGEIIGLVTLQDLLEALTGEFNPRDNEDVWSVQREDGSWLLDGMIPILELKDRLELKAVPEEGMGYYHTLSGMIMWLMGKVPGTGDIAAWDGWKLEVVDLDGNRIDKVLASRLPDSSDNAGNPGQS